MGHAVIPGALCGSKSLSLDGGNSGQFRHFSPGPICAEQMGTTALLDSMGRRTKNPGSELDMDADGVGLGLLAGNHTGQVAGFIHTAKVSAYVWRCFVAGAMQESDIRILFSYINSWVHIAEAGSKDNFISL